MIKMATDRTGAVTEVYDVNRNFGDTDHEPSWHSVMHYLGYAAHGDGTTRKAAMQSSAEKMWAIMTADQRGGRGMQLSRAASAMRSDRRGRPGRLLGRGEDEHERVAGFMREQYPLPDRSREERRRT